MKMKTIFKKITATMLAATMVVGMSACGSNAGTTNTSSSDSSSSSGTTTEAGGETTAAVDNSDIKIGVSIWSSTDVLGSQCKDRKSVV